MYNEYERVLASKEEENNGEWLANLWQQATETDVSDDEEEE